MIQVTGQMPLRSGPTIGFASTLLFASSLAAYTRSRPRFDAMRLGSMAQTMRCDSNLAYWSCIASLICRKAAFLTYTLGESRQASLGQLTRPTDEASNCASRPRD